MAEYDPNNPGAVNGSDDLTRFLDEDFGTDEVDLFEFTSGEEESPLKQLKTIILGLDWEITDESLQDLADEIEHLRYLEQFEHDKVSQVYLQALDKIGNYLLIEGAYAHPNAIKLLLTLFYDFEKIISSTVITGAEITALLKSDVRKFKILQYQIAQKHGAAVTEATAAAAELPLTDHKTLLDIHAAILELDWEISDEGLNQLKEHLAILQDQFADNRYIQIVAKGLITLTTYIDEERARTHPEAFTLLHHFFEALEILVDDKELDEERSQKILISCVNRLNTLKNIISQTPQELGDEAITPIGEQKEEITPEPIEEPVSAPPPPPSAQDDEYEDELDVELPVDETGEVAPALSLEGEEGGFSEETAEEAPPDELTDKLDSFFGGEDEAVGPPPGPEAEAMEEEPDEEEEVVLEAPVSEELVEEHSEAVSDEVPSAALEGVAGEKEAEDELDVELPTDDSGEVAPALFDSGEEGGFAENADTEEAPPEELADKLDSFFGSSDDESLAPPKVEEEETIHEEPEEEVVLEAPVTEEIVEEPPEEIPEETPEDVAEETATAPIEGVAGEKEAEDELDVELPVDDSGEVAPALFDSGEEGSFAESTADESPPEELEDKLDFFFGETEESESFEPEAIEEKVAQQKAEEKRQADEEQKKKEEEEEVLSVSPALAGEIEDEGFTAGEESGTPSGDLSAKLDSFFDEDEEPGPAEQESEITLDEETSDLSMDEEEEDEVLLTSELSADEDDDTVSDLSAEAGAGESEDIRTEFTEREQELLDQIEALKKEIETLKNQS